MNFYHNLITEKSFKFLQELHKKYQFVLIGGWAVFLYAKTLKSKDIDIIVEYEELEKLKKNFDLIKNQRLKKYEIKKEEIDIDVYLPHFSSLGLPTEEVLKYLSQREGFKVPKIEALLILKQQVFGERKNSVKGKKDKLDILSLIKIREINWEYYQKILKKYRLEKLKNNLTELLKETKSAPEIGLNAWQMAKLKKRVLPFLF
ncbi:MAG: hypothetical protein A3A94_00970 [Candidatus Portnoybacteria bacterium RIFCSPLOWO2_01_FULL_43_11]|uniref:DUF6036 domain-containing protein n=4 Tax=Candidatus Portnoyibacteriota TaxID=1817913 RepID=A0A1G2FA06_9BACT|nr:MAG: hypothetical protein A2815_00805 [Candidatus Portnoybacteria bacterium RIFCSPHIGHO2_01_FULL_40_12b]OGZ36411.1 MAG: hypothetical protein A3D38_00995 [Candidatus Portnoybacteria bacterium RIFCSPHIGHO2_02_FULL_40_23]OGZ38368.1 MAG: hypothetical protein A3E90_00710 [Candidatus Portnoybacteria bacterium RIFCSPHIGHO2_12_FULL_40_11]OGZ39016.1 MAG: hypothetical protein A3A94_00970 [Candidatus Portnoybacteria bacterium RIFCSPLOWO2_01_FULL_43_11]OGZ40029.1 MAG: hypothetical protein A3I20_01400 [C